MFMASITSLKASDGTGNASVATVQSVRSSGATTLVVDTVQGINTKFHATMGTPHTFVDPVTSETITVISEASAVDFQGHVDGGNLEIDTIAPGFTDNGSAVSDIVIIKPTTQWADEVAKVLEVTHNDDGTIDAQSVANFRDHIDMTDGKAIRDGNDNEVIKISQTTSAVNELTVKNAATGNAVELQATGGDTNIDLKLKAKGAGVVKLGGLKRQDNTTSSTEGNALIQYGYGVMPTGVTSLKSESVTFPVAYDSAPIVLVSASGDDTGGATSYTSAGAEENIMFAYSHSVTASGFTIRVRSEGAVNWSSGTTVFYSWAAIGPKA